MVDGAWFGGAQLRRLAWLGEFLAWQTWRAGKGWIGSEQLVPGGDGWSVRPVNDKQVFFRANLERPEMLVPRGDLHQLLYK